MTESDDSGGVPLVGPSGRRIRACGATLRRTELRNTSGRAEVKTFYPGTAVSAEAERFKLVAGTVPDGTDVFDAVDADGERQWPRRVVDWSTRRCRGHRELRNNGDDSPNGWGGLQGPTIRAAEFTLPHLARWALPDRWQGRSPGARAPRGSDGRRDRRPDATSRDLALRTKPLATTSRPCGRQRVTTSWALDWMTHWSNASGRILESPSNGEPAIGTDATARSSFRRIMRPGKGRGVPATQRVGDSHRKVEWPRLLTDGVLSSQAGRRGLGCRGGAAAPGQHH